MFVCVHSLLRSVSYLQRATIYKQKQKKKSQEGKITRGPVRLFFVFVFFAFVFFPLWIWAASSISVLCWGNESEVGARWRVGWTECTGRVVELEAVTAVFTSSCRQSRSVRCACRRTAGCCSSWPARPARCSSAWSWGQWRGGRTPARPAPSACGTKALFNHRLASSWRRRSVVFDTPTNGDAVPSDAPHKLWNLSSGGPTGSLEDLRCV